jgi:hypothetical protein
MTEKMPEINGVNLVILYLYQYSDNPKSQINNPKFPLRLVSLSPGRLVCPKTPASGISILLPANMKIDVDNYPARDIINPCKKWMPKGTCHINSFTGDLCLC